MIRETFQLFDKDNDGYVSCKDIGGLLRGLGQNPTEAEIKDFIHEIDEDSKCQQQVPLHSCKRSQLENNASNVLD